MKRNYFIKILRFLPIFYYTNWIIFCSLFEILWLWHELWHIKSENFHMYMYIIIQPWTNVRKIINNSDWFFITVWNTVILVEIYFYCMYPTIYIWKSLLIIFVIFFRSLLIPIDSSDEVKYRSQHHRIITSYAKNKIVI